MSLSTGRWIIIEEDIRKDGKDWKGHKKLKFSVKLNDEALKEIFKENLHELVSHLKSNENL